jgi:hypothetical protein
MNTVWDLSGTNKKGERNIGTISLLHGWNKSRSAEAIVTFGDFITNTDTVQGFGRANKEKWKMRKSTRGIGNDSAQQGYG